MTSRRPNYAFIDNENVNVSVQKQKRKLDRGKFRERLRSEWQVEIAYMFMGYLEEYKPMYEFFESLDYKLIFRPMNPNPDIPNKGNIDTELVLQAMIDWPRYQQAVIVSGDGDFASLVRHLAQKNKLATVIVPNERRYSGFLDQAAQGHLISLNSLKPTLRYKAGRARTVAQTTKVQPVAHPTSPSSSSTKESSSVKKSHLTPSSGGKTNRPPRGSNTRAKPRTQQRSPSPKPSPTRSPRRLPDDNFYA